MLFILILVNMCACICYCSFLTVSLRSIKVHLIIIIITCMWVRNFHVVVSNSGSVSQYFCSCRFCSGSNVRPSLRIPRTRVVMNTKPAICRAVSVPRQPNAERRRRARRLRSQKHRILTGGILGTRRRGPHLNS